MRITDTFELEIAGAIFYIQGGSRWRSWNIRHDHPIENFFPLPGLKGIASQTIRKGDNEIAIKKTEELDNSRSDGLITVADVDYDFLRTTVSFTAGFKVVGKMILQLDFDLVSSHQLLGLQSSFVMDSTPSVASLGVPLVRNLRNDVDWDFNRSFRAYIPVAIRAADPQFHFRLEYKTNQTLPPLYDRVTIDITVIVQVMNSVIRYLGYGEEDEELDDWETI